jgi:hypothetical protein
VALDQLGQEHADAVEAEAPAEHRDEKGAADDEPTPVHTVRIEAGHRPVNAGRFDGDRRIGRI